MKVGKGYLGKRVELVWRDPCSAQVKSNDIKTYSDVPRGRDVLAIQEEQGVIDDITDGVVRIRHTRGLDSPILGDDQGAILFYTWVDEQLVESIIVLEPVREIKDNGGTTSTLGA